MKSLIIFLTIFIIPSQAQKQVKLLFYGSTLDDFQTITPSTLSSFQSLSSNYYNSSKPNVIYIHGWNGSRTDGDTSEVLDAYLTRRNEFNLIFYDWSEFAKFRTFWRVPLDISLVSSIGIGIFDNIRRTNFNIADTHLVGFSFGSLIAGNIGRWFKSNRNLIFPRITGLEPPFGFAMFDPYYVPVLFLSPILVRLQRTDANFVDVIHTNVDCIGDRKMRGHIDFWPSGGVNQPGCNPITLLDLQTALTASSIVEAVGCSHYRAAYFYAESVRSVTPTVFIAKKCPANVTNFSSSACTITSSVSMGFHSFATFSEFDANASVNFYLDVNAESLYSQT